MPLILTHGWPGSIVEFLKLIGPLTDPVSFGETPPTFDVVVPSLPGFGFSQKPTETGWTVSRIASAWVELMKRLGYTRWAAQGGDWGAVVTTALGAMQPEGLLGIHLNTQYAFPAHIPDTLSPEQRYAVETLALYTGDLVVRAIFRARSESADSPWRTLPLVRQPGSTRSSSPRPTTTGSPRTPSAWTTCSTRYPSTGSPTARRHPAASTGRTNRPLSRAEADASGSGDRLPAGHPTPATKLDRRHL